jgi:hypothetical protein
MVKYQTRFDYQEAIIRRKDTVPSGREYSRFYNQAYQAQ